MRRFAFLFSLVLLGCSGSVADGSDRAGTNEGASTEAPSASLEGKYEGHMRHEFDGFLDITNASDAKLDFVFDILPDDDDAHRSAKLDGTAVFRDGRYQFTDGGCEITIERSTDAAAKRGDIVVSATLSCGKTLGLAGHTTIATAVDFSATWHRL